MDLFYTRSTPLANWTMFTVLNNRIQKQLIMHLHVTKEDIYLTEFLLSVNWSDLNLNELEFIKITNIKS